MTESAYYWAIVGRIPFDDEDTVYCTGIPITQSEAIDNFRQSMAEDNPDAYRAHGVIITAVLRSTKCIDLHDRPRLQPRST
jgi:hypothetical protein